MRKLTILMAAVRSHQDAYTMGQAAARPSEVYRPSDDIYRWKLQMKREIRLAYPRGAPQHVNEPNFNFPNERVVSH